MRIFQKIVRVDNGPEIPGTCYSGLKWECWPMKKTKIFITAQLTWASACK